jgi:hypothetical protein
MGTFDEKSISEAKQKLPNIIREAAKGYEVITRNFKSSSKEKTSIISTEIFEEILDYIIVLKNCEKKQDLFELIAYNLYITCFQRTIITSVYRSILHHYFRFDYLVLKIIAF